MNAPDPMNTPAEAPRPGPVSVSVPHDGEGTMTLVVALEIAEDLLDDPAGRRRAVARIAELARGALERLDVLEEAG